MIRVSQRLVISAAVIWTILGRPSGSLQAFDLPLDRRRYTVLGYIHVGEADAQGTGDVGCRPFPLDDQIKNLKLLKAEAPSKTLQLTLTSDRRPLITFSL